MKFPAPVALLALALWNCQSPSAPDAPSNSTPDSPGKPLGHIRSLYPVLARDGQTWEIEMNLDSLTVLAPLSQVQAYASDSLGKDLLRSQATEWYSQDDSCLFSPLNRAFCLHFRNPRMDSLEAVLSVRGLR
jgi:hypothetical protein